MTVEQMDEIGTAARVLRTGEGSATFQQIEIFVNNPAEIPHLPEQFRRLGIARRPLTYTVLGRDLDLGEADYELPPLKVVEIAPHGQTPNAPARVVLGAEGDGHMAFRVVGWAPPAEPPR